MLEVGQGVPLEIPGLVVLCRGWCGLEGTDQVDTLPQVSPYPSHLSCSCPTETFPVSYHTTCPSSCIPAFTRFSLHLECVPSGKNSTQHSRPPAEVTASGKPTRPELFLPLLLHVLHLGVAFLSVFLRKPSLPSESSVAF